MKDKAFQSAVYQILSRVGGNLPPDRITELTIGLQNAIDGRIQSFNADFARQLTAEMVKSGLLTIKAPVPVQAYSEEDLKGLEDLPPGVVIVLDPQSK